MEMPSQKEQDIAERYVLEHVLTRPNTDIKKALYCTVSFLLISVILTKSVFFLYNRLGISFLPSDVQNFFSSYPVLVKLLCYVLILAIMCIAAAKRICIGMIHLYQHYAPEDVRRRCLFKPTCSEYAILAIEKYGVIVGGYKAYIRLFKRCRGNIYSIDYP